MENLQNRIAESKVWLQQYYSIVIIILLVALASSLLKIVTLESQLESCPASIGKSAIKFKLQR